MLEYPCHTALESCFLFSSTGDPYRHDRALWLLLSVMWPSCLDLEDFTPGTGHTLCVYTCVCLFHRTHCDNVVYLRVYVF